MNQLVCPRCSEPKKPVDEMCDTCMYFESEPIKRHRIGDPEPVIIEVSDEFEKSDDQLQN